MNTKLYLEISQKELNSVIAELITEVKDQELDSNNEIKVELYRDDYCFQFTLDCWTKELPGFLDRDIEPYNSETKILNTELYVLDEEGINLNLHSNDLEYINNNLKNFVLY